MVFVRRDPARRFGYEFDSENARPLTVALAVVAIAGWLLAAYLAMQMLNLQHFETDASGRPDAARTDGCGGPL